MSGLSRWGLVLLCGSLVCPPVTSGERDLGERDHRRYEVAAGKHPSLIVANAMGTLEIEAKKGKLQVRVDGREVPPERLKREGKIVTVLDDRGETHFMFGYFPKRGRDGELMISPDMDPYTGESILGLGVEMLGTADLGRGQAVRARQMLIQTGLSPDTALLVRRVVPESPAEASGIEEASLVVAVNGRSPESVRSLDRAATTTPTGGKLRLTVLRESRPKEIELVVGDHPDWPDPSWMEARFREVLGD